VSALVGTINGMVHLKPPAVFAAITGKLSGDGFRMTASGFENGFVATIEAVRREQLEAGRFAPGGGFSPVNNWAGPYFLVDGDHRVTYVHDHRVMGVQTCSKRGVGAKCWRRPGTQTLSFADKNSAVRWNLRAVR
jgi:hypothetical protein